MKRYEVANGGQQGIGNVPPGRRRAAVDADRGAGEAEVAIDEVIGVMGRATIEAMLEMSAEAGADPRQ